MTEVFALILIGLSASLAGTYVARRFKTASLAYPFAAVVSFATFIGLFALAAELAVRGIVYNSALPDNFIRGN